MDHEGPCTCPDCSPSRWGELRRRSRDGEDVTAADHCMNEIKTFTAREAWLHIANGVLAGLPHPRQFATGARAVSLDVATLADAHLWGFYLQISRDGAIPLTDGRLLHGYSGHRGGWWWHITTTTSSPSLAEVAAAALLPDADGAA